MPTYVYRCEECDQEFERVQRITDDPGAECPSCSSERCVRQVVAAAFHLKGTGWYATDYKRDPGR